MLQLESYLHLCQSQNMICIKYNIHHNLMKPKVGNIHRTCPFEVWPEKKFIFSREHEYALETKEDTK